MFIVCFYRFKSLPNSIFLIFFSIIYIILLLLGFDLIVAYGLWRKLAWSEIAFTVGIVALQIIPYTLFRTYFILKPEDGNLLNQMVIFELLLLGILGILLSIEK